eukprot:7335242-Alexandrium_andersonii.AAC.1
MGRISRLSFLRVPSARPVSRSWGGPALEPNERPVFCPACGATVELARAVRAGMRAGWEASTATMVADHV